MIEKCVTLAVTFLVLLLLCVPHCVAVAESDVPPETESETDNGSYLLGKCACGIYRLSAVTAIASAAAGPFVAVPMLNALGFTAAGVQAGSVAAFIQSTVYGGATTGLFSLAQSAGATEVLSVAGTAVSAGAGYVVGLAGGEAVAKVAEALSPAVEYAEAKIREFMSPLADSVKGTPFEKAQASASERVLPLIGETARIAVDYACKLACVPVDAAAWTTETVKTAVGEAASRIREATPSLDETVAFAREAAIKLGHATAAVHTTAVNTLSDVANMVTASALPLVNLEYIGNTLEKNEQTPIDDALAKAKAHFDTFRRTHQTECLRSSDIRCRGA